MSELTTGGINFLKEETNSKFLFELNEKQMRQKLEKKYQEGYSDGGIKELERIKQEVIQKSDWSFIFELYGSCTEIKGKILCYLDNRISELKGENNE